MSNYHHQSYCRVEPHSDAAKRVSDTYNLHRTAGDALGIEAVGKWFACRLDEGTSDGVLYDSKSDCIRHQHHNEQMYMFSKIVPSTMTYCDAEVMLRVSRRAYDKGLRLVDPDHANGGKELIKRNTTEDMLALARGFATNLILPSGFRKGR
jgi:hypothetical protein